MATTDEATRAAEREATRMGTIEAANAAQRAAERAGTAAVVYLSGHVDEASAYVVDDYPYGFRLRTRIRYWIETTARGSRLCSQTLNPRPARILSIQNWNKPKKSTYSAILVLCLVRQADGAMHVSTRGIHSPGSADEARIDAFAAEAGHALTERDRRVLDDCRAVARAMSRITYTVVAGPTVDIMDRAAMAAEVARQEERRADERRERRIIGALVANERAALDGAPLPVPALGTAATTRAPGGA